MALVTFVASLSWRGPDGAFRPCGTDTMAKCIVSVWRPSEITMTDNRVCSHGA
jgi:hypothetical protein